MSPLSIYLHIPFCLHRCAYCDFNTYAGQEDSIPAYVDALIREIHFLGEQTTQLPNYQTTQTIFFGGGTPSLLSASQLASILDALRANFTLSPNIEVTLEANPGATSPEFLPQIREAGINRLSFGVQSANPDELRMLERAHNFFDVIDSVKWARQAGFANLNLDLIYALPEQTLARWQDTVRRAVGLGPEHLSLYALTLEHGTPFGRWSARGLLPLPNPDLAADMYEWAGEYLERNGYVQYEISNWAKGKDESGKMKDENPASPSSFIFHPSSFECRHNLQYWRNLPYLGLGAGAHGFANGIRYSNVLRIKTYIDRLSSSQSPITNYQLPLTPAVVNHHKLSLREQMQETMLTGLRLTREGVSDEAFRSRFGMGIAEAFPKEVEELLRLGLVEWVNQKTSEVSDASEVLRLASHARLVANQVFLRFVDG
jgi:oxygen-independent coproporphyrinogen-3 oxidase